MESLTSANRFVLLDHLVEPFHKEAGESAVTALQRILLGRAVKGWEIVDVCGDEVGMPVLIFRKAEDAGTYPEYLVEEILSPQGQDEIQAINEELWFRRDQNWLPACILDNLFMPPIAVFRKSDQPCGNVMIKAVIVPIDMFERTADTIGNELNDQQVSSDLMLACVLHGGLNPVLIMVSKDIERPYEYLVDHAKAGIFGNQSDNVADLIESRSREGWQVCGTFEDSFLCPCVIFKRATAVMPVTLTEAC